MVPTRIGQGCQPRRRHADDPRGQTVTWTNNDQDDHTATSDTGIWDSGQMAPGNTFAFTFTDPGTYPYSCLNHPGMAGTIIVATAAG